MVFLRVVLGGILLFLGSILVYNCKKDDPPLVSTTSVTGILGNTAISGGKILSNGTGQILEKGICYNTFGNPTVYDIKILDSDGSEGFTSKMSNLNLSTTYYIRAYATNNAGTSYGNEVQFTTDAVYFNPELSYGKLIDIDGNVYKTIQIGTQNWMAENLRTTKTRSGTPIPYDSEWRINATKGYCWHNNDSVTYKKVYGAIYNSSYIMSSNICPEGWHVPTQDEWITLLDFLGGKELAGGKLKEKGIYHWSAPNDGATNESGFSALPGGMRYGTSNPSGSPYSNLGITFRLACDDLWTYQMSNEESAVMTGLNAGYWDKPGFYVRCMKDN